MNCTICDAITGIHTTENKGDLIHRWRRCTDCRIGFALLRLGWMVKMNRSTLVRRRTQAALSTQIPSSRLMIFAQYARNEPKVVPLLH